MLLSAVDTLSDKEETLSCKSDMLLSAVDTLSDKEETLSCKSDMLLSALDKLSCRVLISLVAVDKSLRNSSTLSCTVDTLSDKEETLFCKLDMLLFALDTSLSTSVILYNRSIRLVFKSPIQSASCSLMVCWSNWPVSSKILARLDKASLTTSQMLSA